MAQERLEVAVIGTGLGDVLVAVGSEGVREVMLGEEGAVREELRRRYPGAVLGEAGGGAMALAERVAAQVERPGARMDLPLDLRGTAFQRRVWEELQRIPAGETISYATLASRVGAPRAVRAAAAACAANRLAVLIPCHRVVGSRGGLTGYRWGLDRKRRLLEMEGVGAAAPAP